MLDDGYEYQGRRYKSLSAIARAITGTSWNGPLAQSSERQLKAPVRKVRCAVYTRKSSEEGLEMEFNSLDAQPRGGALGCWRALRPRLARRSSAIGPGAGPADHRILRQPKVAGEDGMSRLTELAKFLETLEGGTDRTDRSPRMEVTVSPVSPP